MSERQELPAPEAWDIVVSPSGFTVRPAGDIAAKMLTVWDKVANTPAPSFLIVPRWFIKRYFRGNKR